MHLTVWKIRVCGAQRPSCHQQFSECYWNSCQVMGYLFIFISSKFGIPIQFKNIYWALNMCQALCQALEPQRQTRHSLWPWGFPFRQERDMLRNWKQDKHKQTNTCHQVQCDYNNEICRRAGVVSVLSTLHPLRQTQRPKCRRQSTASPFSVMNAGETLEVPSRYSVSWTRMSSSKETWGSSLSYGQVHEC